MPNFLDSKKCSCHVVTLLKEEHVLHLITSKNTSRNIYLVRADHKEDLHVRNISHVTVNTTIVTHKIPKIFLCLSTAKDIVTCDNS